MTGATRSIFSSIDLAAGFARHADAHPASSSGLAVVTGRLRVGPETGPVELAAGDLITLAATSRRLRATRTA